MGLFYKWDYLGKATVEEGGGAIKARLITEETQSVTAKPQ